MENNMAIASSVFLCNMTCRILRVICYKYITDLVWNLFYVFACSFVVYGKLSDVKEQMCVEGRINFLEPNVDCSRCAACCWKPQRLAKADVKKMSMMRLSFTALWDIYNPIACVLYPPEWKGLCLVSVFPFNSSGIGLNDKI